MKKTFLVLCVASLSTSTLKAELYTVDTFSTNNTLKNTAICAVGLAATYGTYKFGQWVMEPENRVFRALENGKSEILETLTFLAQLGITPENMNSIDENISTIAAQGISVFTTSSDRLRLSEKTDRTPLSVTYGSYTVKPSAAAGLRQALVDLEIHVKNMELYIMQIDYCLKNMQGLETEELLATKEELTQLKNTIDTIVLPALNKEMHGIIQRAFYNVQSFVVDAASTYIKKASYRIF